MARKRPHISGLKRPKRASSHSPAAQPIIGGGDSAAKKLRKLAYVSVPMIVGPQQPRGHPWRCRRQGGIAALADENRRAAQSGFPGRKTRLLTAPGHGPGGV